MRTAHAMICLSKYNNVALYYEKKALDNGFVDA